MVRGQRDQLTAPCVEERITDNDEGTSRSLADGSEGIIHLTITFAASARLRTFHRKRLCPRSAKRPQQKSTRYSITPSAISKQRGVAQSDPAPWGKDAPLGRDIERFVTIVITPILSGRHRCYARI